MNLFSMVTYNLYVVHFFVWKHHLLYSLQFGVILVQDMRIRRCSPYVSCTSCGTSLLLSVPQQRAGNHLVKDALKEPIDISSNGMFVEETNNLSGLHNQKR
jgi:hypothetical protein